MGDFMEDKEKRLKFLQDNYVWITAGFTGLTVIVSFILKFIKYIYSNYYFYYYGFSYELFNNNDLNFLYNFGFSILALLCFASLMYCYIQIFNFKKIERKTTIFSMILILISNIFIVYSINSKFSAIGLIVNIVVLILLEGLIINVFWKMYKKEEDQETNINDLLNNFKILPFYLFILIVVFLLNYNSKIENNKSYRIINDNKAIVYSTNDYYLVLDCEIEDNKLVIHKGKQTKISNENIKSDLIKFDDVELK